MLSHLCDVSFLFVSHVPFVSLVSACVTCHAICVMCRPCLCHVLSHLCHVSSLLVSRVVSFVSCVVPACVMCCPICVMCRPCLCHVSQLVSRVIPAFVMCRPRLNDVSFMLLSCVFLLKSRVISTCVTCCPYSSHVRERSGSTYVLTVTL